MNYDDIVKRIPKEYRKEILELNMIHSANGTPGDNATHYLWTIWKNFIEPDIGECPLCYQRVLENYRKMQQSFVELSQKESLLDSC